MNKSLFTWLVVLAGCIALKAQAPAWQWAKDASSPSPETALDVAYDASSSAVYIAGSFKDDLSAKYGSAFTAPYGNNDAFVAKYDALGNVLWAIKLGGIDDDAATGVAVDASGNVYVNGYFNTTADLDPSAATFTLSSSGGQDGFLAKYSSSGAFLWAVKFGGSDDDYGGKLYVDANGAYITGSYKSLPATFYSYNSVVTKTTTAADNKFNAFGAKYNSSGIAQWVISGASHQDDNGYNVVADAGNVYFEGNYQNDIIFYDAFGVPSATILAQQNNKAQIYIVAVSQTGAWSWQTNITCNHGGDSVEGWGFAQDAANLYVTGDMTGDINFRYPSPVLTQTVSSGYDVFLAKLSKSGNFTWRAGVTGSGSGDQIGRSVAVDGIGNVILGGSFTNGLNYSAGGGPNYTSAGGHDVFVTSYSNSGSFLWSTTAGGPTRDYMNGLSVDNVGGVYIAGEEDGAMVVGTTTLASGGGHNIFVAKLGCTAITNNTIAASQTVCTGSAPVALTGSSPTGGSNYLWQTSANSLTWTAAPGTNTNQAYSPGTLTATAYYRRNVYATGACSAYVSSSSGITVTVSQPPSTASAGSNQTLCAASATLSATVPAIGAGQWSLLSGSGNITSTASPSSQVTSLGAGSNKFVWTVTNGSCPPSSSTVTVVQDVAPTANAGTSQSLCAASATLNALNPAVGTGSWSLVSGAGTLASPASYSSTVTSLGTGTNVFLWTVANGSCPSATSAVSLVRYAQPTANAGSNQTVCALAATLSAVSPTNGTGAWSLLSGAGNITSAGSSSSSVNGLGTGANSFLWTVSNGSCPSATAMITVWRDAQPTALAGSNQTLCTASATFSAANPTIGTGSWSLLSGAGNITSAGSYSSAVTSLGTGTNSFLWTVTNGSCPPATSSVSIVRDVQPAANAGSNQQVCAATVALGATNPTVGTGSWSLLSGSGNITAAGNASSAVTSLATGTTVLLWTVSNGSCPSATSAVTVVRDVAPIASAGSNQTVCAASASLSAVNPSPGIGNWSVLSGSGSVTSANSSSTTITALGTGTNVFLWTVSNGSCPSATSAVTIVRNAMPSANAGSNQTLCSSSVTLAAVSPSVGTGAWSLASGSGNIVSANSFSTQVTGLTPGNNVFLWTVSNGSCPPATSSVLITSDAPPVANAGNSQTVCSSSINLAAVTPTIGSGNWSLLSGSGTIAMAASYSSAVTSLGTGSNSFLWTVTNGSCPSATAAVTIVRDVPPVANAGSNQTICAGSAVFAAVNPSVGTGSWSLLSGSGNISSATSFSSSVSSLGIGSNSFLWTVTNGSCPAATATVTIQRDAMPVANAGSNQTVCASSATLNAVNPSVGTGSWQLVSGSGNLTAFNSYSSGITALGTGTNMLVWTVSNGSCPSASSAVVVTRGSVLTAQAGSDQTVCATAATLNAVGSGTWSVLSGTGNIVSPNNPGSQVTGLSAGINTFMWTIPNGGCSTTPGTVTIVRNAQVMAMAGSNQTICAASATMSAVQPTVGTGSWSFISGSGNLTSAGSYSSGVTSLGTGTNLLLWTVTNGNCPPATATVALVRDAQPTGNAGTSQTICASQATLSAAVPSVGSGSWSLLSGSGNIALAGSNSSSVSSLGTGTNSFLWTVSNGSCPSATSVVNIVRDLPPTANAGSDQTICAGSATLAAVNPSVGLGTWSVLSGPATVASANSYSSPVTALATGSNVFLWTVVNGSCPPATASVVVTRDAQPSANAGLSQTLCASAVTLNAVAPAVGSGSWSLISGAGSIVSAGSYSSPVTSLSVGVNSFLWTVNNGSCPPATSTVSVTRDAQPTANAGSSQTICTSSATLSATSPTVGTGSWSMVSGAGNIMSTATSSSQVSALNAGVNSFLWTVANGSCPSATAMVTITRELPPTADAGLSQTVCAASAGLEAVNPVVGTGSWSVLSGSGTFVSAGSNSTQVNTLGTGTNVFLWTVTNGSCPSATSAVTVVQDVQPTSNAGSSQSICTLAATLNALAPGVGSGAWSLISGAGNIVSVSSASSQVTSLSAGSNVFRWTVTNGSCPPATSTIAIVRDIQPTAFAGTNQTLCSASTTLNALAPAVGTGSWSVMSGSAMLASATSNSTSVSALGTGSTVLVWTVNNGSCPPATSSVTVVRDLPPAANAGINQTLCASAATLNAVVPIVGAGSWSLLSGSGNIISAGSASSQVTSLSTGTNTFLWTVANGSCPSATTAVTLVRDAQPTAIVGSDQDICANTATIDAQQPLVGTGSWSLLAGSGTLLSSGSASSQVTSLGTGTNSFLWTVSNGSCPSATAILTVVRDIAPTANAGISQTLCASTATFTAVNPVAGSGAWSLLSGSGNIIASADPTSQVTNLSTGVNLFLWTVSNGNCPAATATVAIVQEGRPNANAGANQHICASSATLMAVDPAEGSGVWSVLSGSGIITSANSYSSDVTSIGTGTNSFLWTVTNGICPSAQDTVMIVRSLPVTANAGADQTVCATSVTLNAIAPLVGTGHWSVVTGSANIASVNSYSTLVTSLGADTTLFLWTVTNGSCPPARDSVVVVRDAAPLAFAGSNQTVCASSATLQATSPSVGTGSWSVLSGSASVISAGSFSSAVTLSDGSNVFVWTVTNGVCPPASDTVLVQRDEPVLAFAGPDQQVCGATATLSAISPTTGSGNWVTVSSSATIEDPSRTGSDVVNLQPGSNLFAWVVSSGVCPVSADTVNVTSFVMPDPVSAMPDLSTCLSQVTCTAMAPLVGTGTWSLVSGNGSISINDNSVTVIMPSTDTITLRWTVRNGICPETFDDVTVTRTTANHADAGTDQTVERSTAQLSATLSQGATGTWQVLQGDASVSDVHDPNAALTHLSFGNNILRWTVSGGACPDSSDDVLVFVKPLMIPNGFSPNGDGLNDRFKISSLDYYSRAGLSVYNRWGLLLYQNDHYQNDWEGTNMQNDRLTDDTYYYVLEIEGLKTFTGFVIIKQNK